MEYGKALPEDFEIPAQLKWLIKKDLTTHNPFDLIMISKGDYVMDIGGCVGTFSGAALEQGADKVRCYEPIPKNFRYVLSNLSQYGYRVECINAAVTAGTKPEVEISMGTMMGSHSLNIRPQDKQMTVKALNFREELLEFRPQILKLDVEGAEYDLMDSLKANDLESLDTVFIEFHPIDSRKSRVERIWKYLQKEGFSLLNKRLRAFTVARAR